ncbi:MAG: hypothetical protein GTN76_05805 [Candidatus Aenigmarchaeota archaeon]|nr:hypothetical protein [Candidatus Aenigmarchaeota archaeon]
MLRKEIQEVFKQSLIFLAVVVVISFVLKIVKPGLGSYIEIFYQMYHWLLMWFGAFMGLSLFLSDKRQQAEDYVFSLPYSRLRLLGIKVLPRLTALVIIYIIYLGGIDRPLMGERFYINSWLYLIVFVLTLSFSASADSYMKVGGIALLGTIIFLQLFYFSGQLSFLLKGVSPQSISRGILHPMNINSSGNLNLVPFLVVCSCLLIPYILSFLLAFKKWGTYSKANYNKNYFKLFLPLIAVVFILSTLFVYSNISRRYHGVMLRATMGDMFIIGKALKYYIDDYNQAPKANSIKELSKILQPFYIKTLPLADAWENELLYKVDPKNPKNYWVGSPGSDGKFQGFDQKGTWKFKDGEKGQDIVLANGDFTYKPDLEEKK